MGSSEILPDRSEIGDKSFSPAIDRLSLLALTFLGIVAFPEICLLYTSDAADE